MSNRPGFWTVCTLLAALFFSADTRGEAVGAIHPDVTRALARLQGGKLDAYAHLRELWEAWEVANPAQVEEALRVAASDEALTPSARVYAALLEAYARRRRGNLDGARRGIAELGFVSDWLVVGPFNNDNKSGMAERMVPELELAEPVLFDRSYPGKERAVRWRRSPDVHRWGYFDLGAMLRPERDACGFSSTYVRDARKAKGARKLSVWVGATGAFRLFVDAEMVLEDTGYRQLDADRRAVPIALEPGFHRITVKVCADETPPALALRFAEPDGSVARELEITTRDAAINEAAQRMRNEKSRKLRTGEPFGPVDRFEQQLARSANDAGLLESYARYLAVTGGDPEATHQARDLARRAADAAPTVARLLLAAELAEDRNGTRELVERAAPLARSTDERVDVLLAQARLARTGPNWREAFPLYNQLLRLEPTHVAGILGKVDLFVEAGLKRTALATLQRAAAAQPSSVALLRALAGQLRALGRDADAAEVEGRYAAMRFDDGSYLSDQLGLAVARRDAAGVRRWAARLTESEPASSWAHDVVARAFRAIGDTKGAIQAYERTLAVAPEEIGAMRALADIHGAAGRRSEQLAYLKRILRIVPQAKGVRAYLEHIEPTRRRQDEAYAWAPDRFLELRTAELSQKRKEHPRRVLRQLSVATVFDNGLASHFHQVVFQPLTDESAARSRQHAFVYHADRQVVQLRAAKVYRKDGRIDEAIESGEAPLNDPSINMYTLQRTFYVQFPRLEPGDVVELRYRIDDIAPRNEMSDYFGEVEYLQSDEPIANSEYILLAPSAKRLHVATGPGALPWLKKDVKKRGATTVYRFTGKNVPPLEAESRMPRFGEVAGHVHVSTFSSWKQVGAWYWSLARDMLPPDDEVRKLARKLAAGKTEVADKVAAVYHYAATETRYVALEFGIEGIRPRPAALTLARGWGDCKDKATLIVSMLRELGIDAELVLVRTGLRGDFDPTIASLAPFDHAIAYVPALDLYLDGTAEATGMHELPAMDRGSLALRITGGEGKLVHLPEPAASASLDKRRFEIELSDAGEIRFRAELESRGADASGWRKRYHAESTRLERLAGDLGQSFGSAQLIPGKLTVSDLDALEQPVVVKTSGTAKAKRDGALWAVPMGPAFSMVSRYAPRSTRSYDVLIGPLAEHDETWELNVPRGTKLQALPRPARIESPFGVFELEVKSDSDDKLTVRTRLRIDKPRVKRSEFARWRAFCEQIDRNAAPRVLAGK